jgi:hypothetical protein
MRFLKRRSGGNWARHFAVAAAILLAAPLASGEAEPKVTATSEQTAESHFDRAVEHFRNAHYEAAARAFLSADQLKPDSDTLSNALNSAKSSGSHLLIALISERAIEVHQGDPALVRLARSALAASLPHLGRLRLECAPSPCEVLLDDHAVAPGRHLVDPGTHRLSGRFAEGLVAPQTEQVIQIAAGTAYVFRLVPEQPAKNEDEDEPKPSAEQRFPVPPSGDPPDNRTYWQRSGDEVVFTSGIATTAVLGGLLVWSGTDVLKQSGRLPDQPTPAERSQVQSKIRRTDILLGATLVAATFSAVWGFIATDFRGESPRPELSILPSGDWSASIRGDF